MDSGPVLDAFPNAPRARVWIIGQQRHDVGLTNVRLVDTRVGAHKAMARLGDQHTLRSNYADALVEDDLDQARVGQIDELRGDALGLVTGFDCGEVPQLALRLRDHLLGDDEHVRRFELGLRADQVAEVIAGMDLGKALHATELEAVNTARRSRARSAGSSRSSAIAGDR